MNNRYGFGKTINTPFNAATTRVMQELQTEVCQKLKRTIQAL